MAARSVLVRPSGSSDLDGLAALDTAFVTDRIYQVRRDGLAFRLDVQRVDPPIAKSYPRPRLELSDRLLVACADEADGELVGYGELECEAWNGRARIEHIYVSSHFRGRGAGRALIDALAERAGREPSARCLWLETQNVNYPAVQFYLRMGFRLCGLDETLYRPGDPHILPGEVALYFARDLPG
jgi:ribosomal protein S18 acetylase RimI-like enzyme